MDKSPDAFRTISEVADWLDTPAHVLRFWESRFTQVKPVKRAGGRRYYRPADMALLGGIKKLLHDDGMTIRGVQKLLREHGVKYVASLSPLIEGVDPISAQASGALTPVIDAIPTSNPLANPPAPPAAQIADAPMAENVPHDAFDIPVPAAEKIVHFSRPSSPAPHSGSEPTPSPVAPLTDSNASFDAPVATPVPNQAAPDQATPDLPPLAPASAELPDTTPFAPHGFEPPASFVEEMNAEMPPAAEDAAAPELTHEAMHDAMAESVFEIQAEEALPPHDRDQDPMADLAEFVVPSPLQDTAIGADVPEQPALPLTTEQRTFDFDLTPAPSSTVQAEAQPEPEPERAVDAVDLPETPAPETATPPSALEMSAEERAILTDGFDEALPETLSDPLPEYEPASDPAVFAEELADVDLPDAAAYLDAEQNDVIPTSAELSAVEEIALDSQAEAEVEAPQQDVFATAPLSPAPLGVDLDLYDDPDEAAADLVMGDGILGKLNHRDLIRVPRQDIASLLARAEALHARLVS